MPITLWDFLSSQRLLKKSDITYGQSIFLTSWIGLDAQATITTVGDIPMTGKRCAARLRKEHHLSRRYPTSTKLSDKSIDRWKREMVSNNAVDCPARDSGL